MKEWGREVVRLVCGRGEKWALVEGKMLIHNEKQSP